MLRSMSTGVRYRPHLRLGGTEMGLMSRAGEIIRAKFSALLNRAENPQETLDYSYEKQLESLQNVKRGVADVVTAKKRLQIQTQQLEQNVVKLDTQARQAVAANREDLARAALERKSGIQQQLQARGSAIDELVSSGDLEELGSDKTQLDRELAQLASKSQVDRELEQLKSEVGSGPAPPKQLEGAQQSEQEPRPGA